MKQISGFVEIDRTTVDDPAFNAERTVNEFSPYAEHEDLVCEPGRFFVDRYYGQVYEAFEPGEQAIYGGSDRLPAGANDRLANHGYLRVPFRRIPRRVVRNVRELKQTLSEIRLPVGGELLFRGQTSEHLLPRDDDSRRFLFGDPAALEPSLVTSAERNAQPLEDALPEWALLIRLFLHFHVETLRGNAEPRAFERIEADARSFGSSPAFHMFAIALAQHYGLPTAGLDVSHRPEVGLFFALMKYESLGGPYAEYRKTPQDSGLPVLYLLYPDTRFQTRYDDHRPGSFPPGRPDAQAASFMPCSWGCSVNNCARSVFFALYLDPEGDFGPIPPQQVLFPGVERDPFAAFLLAQARSGLPEILARPFERFYVVDPTRG